MEDFRQSNNAVLSTYTSGVASGAATPSSLPSISRAEGSVQSRRSAILVNNIIGFVCCDTITYHAFDAKCSSKPAAKKASRNSSSFSATELEKALNSQAIVSSLRFESQMFSALNVMLALNLENLIYAFRNLAQLSNIDQIAFCKSILPSQKGKFSEIIGKRQSLPLGLERREFLCGVIYQLDIAKTRLFSDILADRQYRDFLRDLPESIVQKILDYFNASTRGKLSMVNHAYYQLIDSARSPSDSATVTRLIELDNPMPNIPSFQKAFAEMQSRENFRSGKFCRISELEGHTGRILCVAMWRNYIASGGSDKTIRIWTVNNSRHVCTLTGHQAGVWCLQFFAKLILFSGSYDGTIRLWSIKRARCLRELRGHGGPVWGLKVDGNFLLSGSQDKLAIMWDAVRMEPIHYFTGHKEAIFAVDLCIADAIAVTGSADRSVKLWSVEDGQMLKSIMVGYVLSVTAVAYSRGYVAAASNTQIENAKPIVIRKSANNGGRDSVIQMPRHLNISNYHVEFEEEHNKRIESLGFRISNSNPSQVDGVLITSSKDGHVKYWDLSSKSSLQTFKPLNGGTVNCVYFDAYRVAVAGEDNRVRIYDFSLSAAALQGAGFGSRHKAPNKKLDSRLKSTHSKNSETRSVTFISDIAE